MNIKIDYDEVNILLTLFVIRNINKFTSGTIVEPYDLAKHILNTPFIQVTKYNGSFEYCNKDLKLIKILQNCEISIDDTSKNNIQHNIDFIKSLLNYRYNNLYFEENSGKTIAAYEIEKNTIIELYKINARDYNLFLINFKNYYDEFIDFFCSFLDEPYIQYKEIVHTYLQSYCNCDFQEKGVLFSNLNSYLKGNNSYYTYRVRL